MQGQNGTFYHDPVQCLASVVTVNALMLLYIAFLFFGEADKEQQ